MALAFQPAGAQRQVPTDYVFLIDVSGSMVGVGGTANIFPQVKETVNDFIGEIGPGSDVYIAPFDASVHEIRRFQIKGAGNIQSAQAFVNNLRADGTSTAIYNSVNTVVRTVNKNRASSVNPRTAVFFVYTDGNDNVSKDFTLQSFLENFRLNRGQRDWLFYTELGLPRNRAKEQVFSQVDRVKYIQEARGGVHPIIQIEPLLPILNYGNLKKQPGTTRVQKFATRGSADLPSAVSVSAEAVFPELQRQGVLAEVSPSTFSPRDSIALKLALTNASALAEGDYKGSIRLSASDELVMVVPSEIEVSFTYGPDREVFLEPGSAGKFPLEFGKVQAVDQPSTRHSRTFKVRFSSTAARAGIPLRFALEEDSGNPVVLGSRVRLVTKDRVGDEATIPPGAGEATLEITVDSTLRPGSYQGTIRFDGEGLLIRGNGLQPDPSGAQLLEWRMQVRRPPIPLWVWLALVAALLAIAAVVARHFLKPAVFTDLRLDVLEPARQSIDLAGRREAQFGAGRELLPASTASFSIVAKKAGRSEKALLNLETGQISLKKQGVREPEQILGDEEIFDGDVLQFGEYRIRVASFSMVRET